MVSSSVDVVSSDCGSDAGSISADSDGSESVASIQVTNTLTLDDPRTPGYTNGWRPTIRSPLPTAMDLNRGSCAYHSHIMKAPSDYGIKDALRLLHADEIVSLAQEKGSATVPSDDYSIQAKKIVFDYLGYLWTTWTHCAWSLVALPATIADRISMVAFAFFSSWILFGIMIWCLAVKIPFVVDLFDKWSNKSGGGLSMTNASYPSMFRQTTPTEPYVVAAREALARPMMSRHKFHDQEAPRIFNVDVAKLLFQCAALMYERIDDPLVDVVETTQDQINAEGVALYIPAPEAGATGRILKTAIGTAKAKLVSETLRGNVEENEMTRFAAKLGMKYATISELNSQTSAFSGLFWDPKSTYIILAFKGTQPDEFGEWSGDFSYEPRDAGDWIRGFGKVHGGFLERIFPRKLAPGARVPYYTIRDAVRRTAALLSERHPPGTKINVWFTGHSLGTAIASLVYARAVNEPRDFGPNVVLRDAFMFAAPILCDVQSAHAFHNRMYHDERRTMWRITNAHDCVATALPDWGDNLRVHLSPYNLFSFSHLGIELTMHSFPTRRVLLSGNAMPQGSPVIIESVGNEIEESFSETSKMIEKLTAIPVFGRIISHGTAPYWDQLLRIQPGYCEWKKL